MDFGMSHLHLPQLPYRLIVNNDNEVLLVDSQGEQVLWAASGITPADIKQARVNALYIMEMCNPK